LIRGGGELQGEVRLPWQNVLDQMKHQFGSLNIRWKVLHRSSNRED
jgi:hypothetical protein